jgi:hypothetical protein
MQLTCAVDFQITPKSLSQALIDFRNLGALGFTLDKATSASASAGLTLVLLKDWMELKKEYQQLHKSNLG